MSVKSPAAHSKSLEITGSLLELPPVRETTKAIEKKTPEVPKKQRVTSLLLNTPAFRLTNRAQANTPKKVENGKDDTCYKEQLKQLEEENRKLKKRIEELEAQLKTSNKSNKDKDKIIEELHKKLESCKNEENAISKRVKEIEDLCNSLKEENESLMKQLKISEELNKSVQNSNAENERIKTDYEQQIKKLKEEHAKEIKQKDTKLDLLKKQVADAFKDNSWERQAQIEELNKELKRTQEEYEMIKHKLKGYKNKHADSCENCAEMLEKLTEKNNTIKEKDSVIGELMQLIDKFKLQANLSDDLLKLVANKLYVDSNSKNGTINNRNNSNNNNNKLATNTNNTSTLLKAKK